MDNQSEVIKKTSILIGEKKYFQAKEILLNFIQNAKNIKIDIKVFYNLYLVSNSLDDKLTNANIFSDTYQSDHCPIGIELNFNLI